MKRADYAVYIGRFQPFHNGHMACVQQALEKADRIIILVGSVNRPRNTRDPFSYAERRMMIEAAIPEAQRERVVISGVPDSLYNLARWVETVQESVAQVVKADGNPQASIAMVGYRKDHTSAYLDLFPQWFFISVNEIAGLEATIIRDKLFGVADSGDMAEIFERLPLPDVIRSHLKDFMTKQSGDWHRLLDEHRFIQKYKSGFKSLPYPVIFQTVDAVVLQAGHILLVQRGAQPGNGLWALPGGFLDASERIDEAVLRELREETGIKVPEPVLRGSIRARVRYDDPMRSLRGRTITDAFLFELRPGPLPKIKGGSDANKAQWVSLAEYQSMENAMYEDHYHIVQDLLGRR